MAAGVLPSSPLDLLQAGRRSVPVATTARPSPRLLRRCRRRRLQRAGSRDYLLRSDEQLMEQCELSTFKASGPGGQHRNKRESAVRLKQLPTGITAQAVEDRSQHMSHASALGRLRTLLVLKVEGSVPEAAKLLGQGILCDMETDI